MSNRHLSRTIALQTLFEWDFHHRSRKLFDILERNSQDFAPEFDDAGFTQMLIKGITKNLPEIDALIQKYAPEWPLEQITIVDRNILRIGMYELKLSHEVPPKVAINEAIELAKTFGGPSSHRFVNGVLGSLFKDTTPEGQLAEDATNPDAPAIAAHTNGLAPEPEPQEISAGGLVYRRAEDGSLRFGLILDAINKWTFPKGKVGDKVDGEDLKAAAEREIKEELGLKELEIQDDLGSISVTVNPPDKPSYPKTIYYFLVATNQVELTPEKTVTCQDARWFTEEEVWAQLGYRNTKEIFQKGLDILKNQAKL